MRAKKKRLVAVLVMFCIVSALAVFFSTLLGKAYLEILDSGEIKSTPKPSRDITPVIKQQTRKSVELLPVPVFFLQGGVFSDLQGARKAAEDLLAIGVDPYITQSPPFRLYIGFFGSREEAEKLKDYLAEEGISTFVQSYVLNATVLTYGEEEETLVNKWAPYLDRCSQLLKNIEKRCNFGAFAQADREQLEEELPYLIGEFDEVTKALNSALPEEGEFGQRAQSLEASLSEARDSMKKLGNEWNQQNFDRVSKGLIDFVYTYHECWNSLIEPKKT